METRTANPAGHGRLAEVSASDDAPLAELAALTRTAFAEGDMLPGLPAADGVSDTAESIRTELGSGIRMWMVCTESGRAVGCVRAIPRGDELWQIRRLAVAGTEQGTGVGRRLVRGLERAAAAEGVDELVVWALVERGIAPFYSRLGYRTTGHFGSPDKPLSEAIMELDLSRGRAVLPYPWGTEPYGPRTGPLVSWFSSGRRTVAVVGSADGAARSTVARHRALALRLMDDVVFRGGDGWPDGDSTAMTIVHDRLAAAADAADGSALLFRRHFLDVAPFTMPRTVHPELLALWRCPVDGDGA